MKTEYLTKLAELEKLIKKMNLPSYRKKVKHNDDVRWLKNNLAARNENHGCFKEAIKVINGLV